MGRRLIFIRPSFSNLYSWQGDGVNKHAIKSIVNYRSGDSAGSITGWMKTTQSAATILSSATSAGTNDFFLFRWFGSHLSVIQNTGGAQSIVNSTTTVVDSGSWVFVAITSNGTAWKMYVNGTLQTLSVIAGSNNGNWFADTPGRNNLVVGGLIRSITSGFANAKFANLGVWDGELSAAELALVRAKVMGDLRTVSVTPNLVNAWYFPNGTADYPTWFDYVGSDDLTMTNNVAGDITTDVPV